MEDQNVKRYFIKRGIIVLSLLVIAAAVYFGIQIYENAQPCRVKLVDISDDGFAFTEMLEERYRYEKLSVMKVVEKIKPPCGVIYNVNTRTDLVTDEYEYRISPTDMSWLYYSLQEGYNDYQRDYKPEHTIEESMQACVGQGAVSLMLCKCTDGENYAYCGVIYYAYDTVTLLHDVNFYICEDEAEYDDGTAAMEKLLDWMDGYIELVKEKTDAKK